jgi:hypothetical protein
MVCRIGARKEEYEKYEGESTTGSYIITKKSSADLSQWTSERMRNSSSSASYNQASYNHHSSTNNY